MKSRPSFKNLKTILWDDRPSCESCDYWTAHPQPTRINIHGFISHIHMGRCSKSNYHCDSPRDNKSCVSHTHKGVKTYGDSE